MNGKLWSLTQQQVGEKEWAKVVGGKCCIQPIFGYLPGKTWRSKGNTLCLHFEFGLILGGIVRNLLADGVTAFGVLAHKESQILYLGYILLIESLTAHLQTTGSLLISP